jgi:NTP pyrophosphatase (non-canonical NTP hydrolase)
MEKKTDYLNEIAAAVHEQHKNWWIDLDTGLPKERNTGELLMLIVSEIAEAMEGDRKGLMDDHLPHRSMFEVELADTLIRIFDLAGGRGLDLSGAVAEKLEYNKRRADHKVENRKAEGGKKY